MFAYLQKKLYFCTQRDKNDRKMLNRYAYFYGYYFYFAATCEAVSRM